MNPPLKRFNVLFFGGKSISGKELDQDEDGYECTFLLDKMPTCDEIDIIENLIFDNLCICCGENAGWVLKIKE